MEQVIVRFFALSIRNISFAHVGGTRGGKKKKNMNDYRRRHHTHHVLSDGFARINFETRFEM